MKPSGVHHVAICVSDVDEAVRFYEDVLGCSKIARPDGLGDGAWLQAGAAQVHLMRSDDRPAGFQHFAMQVDDIDACVADIRAAGVAVGDPSGIEGICRQAFVNDPSGNVIELNQPL